MKLINTAIICHKLHFYLGYIRYQSVPGKQPASILVKNKKFYKSRRELTMFPLLISNGIWMLKSHISEADEVYFRLFTIKVIEWAELLFRIWQVPGSNLDPETGYLGWRFFVIVLSLLRQILRLRPKLRHGHFLPQPLIFIAGPSIEQLTVLVTAGPLNKPSRNNQKENLSLLIKNSGQPWHKHQPDNTGILPLNEDDKNRHRCFWQWKIKYCSEF